MKMRAVTDLVFSAFFLWFAGGRALADADRTPVPEYECHQVETPPKIDGNLDDPCWKRLPTAGGFFSMTDDYVLWRQTSFQAGWDDRNLYVAIVAEEPYVDRLKPIEGDGEDLFRADSIELFIIPESGGDAYHFMSNPLSFKWNAIHTDGPPRDLSLNAWQAKASVVVRSWSVEFKIPFDVFGSKPDDDASWTVNVARNCIIGLAGERHSSWPKLENGFHDRNRYGRFVFRREALDEAQASRLSKKDPFPVVLVKRLLERAAPYRPVLNEIKAVVSTRDQKEIEQIERDWRILQVIQSGRFKREDLKSALHAARDFEQRCQDLEWMLKLETLIQNP